MKRKKISPKANRFLHATNPRSAVSAKDVVKEPVLKETKFIEGGINNGLPFLKAGIARERMVFENGKKYIIRGK